MFKKEKKKKVLIFLNKKIFPVKKFLKNTLLCFNYSKEIVINYMEPLEKKKIHKLYNILIRYTKKNRLRKSTIKINVTKNSINTLT